ncbi:MULTISPECIES: P-type conjugative transfer protein TrbG [Hyphomicrobiales]|jgi:type IV secretion system protein VirB9|uniref:P-type conjugative transfer protein TrbG n=1 Tax=Hyphomicrobiales TaxID=356 RepID=UPI00193C477D|nr:MULTISPECIES: P-type conjugative transfer protein TrbG [Rhizobiaceae]MCW5712558.1 P-type conjugative transfer protein TrbG [Shinella sp.]MDG3579822.1 P-type conjugative transfer protein TrbG [Rhizobium sp. YJ-22]QRI62606.1 P-type conjugative transfer protein TrbG [Shinella sp. PSBB067]
MKSAFRKCAIPSFRKSVLPVLLLSATMLAGCATPQKPPEITYDRDVPALPAVPVAVTDDRPRPIHTPPGWTPAKGGTAATTPTARVENANAAARVQPRREGYFNAIQVYPWSEGALYQVYAAPGQITNIALEPGESLTDAGPIAAGDTARWIIGDTESGSGPTRRVHILVKPSRVDISTNLVVTTDRRVYMIELRSGAKPYMPSVAWAYPQPRGGQGQTVPATPVIPAVASRNYRYGLSGGNPPWKPVSVYDDGRRVYIDFPRGIVQGEMPPIFVIGPEGEAQIVNTRVHRHILIVDRLFGAAELRLGSGDKQQTVRIVRTDGRPAS